MKLKKPIEEFTLEELFESRESLQGLINATQSIKDNLGDDSDPLVKFLDLEIRMSLLHNPSKMGFRELTEHNLNSFKTIYGVVVEEIAKREL